jgi:hypothetical protein
LSDLAKRHVDIAINKVGQHENYACHRLSREFQKYCAIDAKISRMIHTSISHQLGSDGITKFRDQLTGLSIADNVQVFMRGQVVAKGAVEFVGGGGNMSKWGTRKIGKGLALIRITEVLSPGTTPPLRYIAETGNDTCGKQLTLFDIIQQDDPPLIAAKTSSLLQAVPSQIKTIQRATPDTVMGSNSETTSVIERMDEASSSMIDNDEWIGPRSRLKEDLWHWYHNLPLPRGCPIHSLVDELLIHASCNFVREDYEAVRSILVTKNVPDIMAHFYHNRERWRQRVRMEPPTAADHAANIRVLRVYIAADPVMNEYYTPELDEYLKSLQTCARRVHFRHCKMLQAILKMALKAMGSHFGYA